MEFGGSGEDSFVAVVVTKLTGALLFILLLTMVIMALLPKAVDLRASKAPAGAAEEAPPLAIATPGELPEAIAVRCDVTDWSDQESLVQKTLDTYGRLDVAFANAGFGGPRGFGETMSLRLVRELTGPQPALCGVATADKTERGCLK